MFCTSILAVDSKPIYGRRWQVLDRQIRMDGVRHYNVALHWASLGLAVAKLTNFVVIPQGQTGDTTTHACQHMLTLGVQSWQAHRNKRDARV